MMKRALTISTIKERAWIFVFNVTVSSFLIPSLETITFTKYGMSIVEFLEFPLIVFRHIGAQKSILMSISDGSAPSISYGNMEKTRLMTQELDGKVFCFRQSRYPRFGVWISKVVVPICTLTWRVNIYVSRQGDCIQRINHSTGDIKRYLRY